MSIFSILRRPFCARICSRINLGAPSLWWGKTPLVSSSCKAVNCYLKEEFVLLEHAKPIVIARDDVVLGTSERFVFPGARHRTAGLRKRNRTAGGRRADRSFFGGYSQSTLIRRCS